MEMLGKIFALFFAASAVSALLRRGNPEVCVLLTLGALVSGTALFFAPFCELCSLLEELLALCPLAQEWFRPLLQSVGIALLARVASAFFRDAGETAFAAMVEIGASLCTLLLAAPLLRAVVALLKEWL